MAEDPSRRRVVFGSLVAAAGLSGLVVAEAERNYASITRSDPPTATAADADYDDDGLTVELRVRNTFNRPLRVRFVRLEVDDGAGSVGVSVPYRESVSLPPGRGRLTPTLSARRVEGLSFDGAVTVAGFVAVAVYRDHRVDVTVEPTEVRP